MGRLHIHFSEDFPNSELVISGMRSSCQIAIFLNVNKALQGIIASNSNLKLKLIYFPVLRWTEILSF